jgi:predicted nucleic acid-binding protein
MKLLLDTCVVSEFAKPRPLAKIVEWLNDATSDDCYLSVITIGEIQHGISTLVMSRRRAALETWLEDRLIPRFDGRIKSLDLETSRTWGRLTAAARLRGRPLALADALIAATAQRHSLSLATRNVSNFEGTGVSIVNPWE